jgi:hypothetical protein
MLRNVNCSETGSEYGPVIGFCSDIQNYWVFGLFPSSGILENRKHDVSGTGSVSVSGEGERRHLLSWAP